MISISLLQEQKLEAASVLSKMCSDAEDLKSVSVQQSQSTWVKKKIAA